MTTAYVLKFNFKYVFFICSARKLINEKFKKLKTCDYMATVSAVTIWITIISDNYLEFRISPSL